MFLPTTTLRAQKKRCLRTANILEPSKTGSATLPCVRYTYVLTFNFEVYFCDSRWIAAYEKAIQPAFRDAADALNARETYVAQMQAKLNLGDADNRYNQLASMRYQGGIDSYLNVLLAENSLLQARLMLIGLAP